MPELFGGPLDGARIAEPPPNTNKVTIGMMRRKTGYALMQQGTPDSYWDIDEHDSGIPAATYCRINGRWQHRKA